MSAIFAGLAIRLHHHGHRIPADVGLDAPFERAVTRIFGLRRDRNGVHVRSVGSEGQIGTGAARVIDQPLEQVVSPLRSFGAQHRIDRCDPLAGLDRIQVGGRSDVVHVDILVLSAPRRPRTRARAHGGNSTGGAVLGCRAPARAAGMIRTFISMVKHTGRLRAPAARILPDLSVAGLQRHGRTPDARAIDSLDALILVAPPAESELWAALPEPGRWRALAARSKPAALKWHATDLANARQTHAVLGYAKPEVSAFERLSFAGKLIGEIAGRRPARVGLLVSESLPDAALWYEALLSAAWSASFALPHFRSEPGEPWRLASLQLYAAPALATE